MDVPTLLRQLTENANRIAAFCAGVTPEQARWKPSPEDWSILEVINHLLDEEREDFRVRLDFILHRPTKAWPPIDPQGWVTSRRYNQRDLKPSLENFLAERRASLEWLASLPSPDWETAHVSPFGTMRAGDMFAAWVTHDQLHLRQLVELHRAYTEQQATPYTLNYAGDW